MKNVVAFIRPESLPQVKQELFSEDLFGLSVQEVSAVAGSHGHRKHKCITDSQANLRIELVVQEPRLKDAIRAIETGSKTDDGSDGMISFHPREIIRRVRPAKLF